MRKFVEFIRHHTPLIPSLEYTCQQDGFFFGLPPAYKNTLAHGSHQPRARVSSIQLWRNASFAESDLSYPAISTGSSTSTYLSTKGYLLSYGSLHALPTVS